jgi:hypothetical protein
MEFLLRNSSYNETLTYLIISSIIIVTCIKLVYNIQFNDFLGALTNSKYFLLHNKNDKKSNLFNHFFYLVFTINLSVFSYIILVSLEFSPENNYHALITSFIIINFYFITKYLIEKIMFEILDLGVSFKTLNFQRLTFINFIGLLLLFLNIIILYISPNPNPQTLYLYLGILFFSYVLSVVIIVLYNQKIVLKHWFYFILYLCALEISPFLIGGVLILTNILT